MKLLVVFSVLDIHRTIIDEMINILSRKSLIEIVNENDELFHTDVALMSSTIILLYNLSFEQEIVSLFKEKNISTICARLHKAKDRRIQFASQTLSFILNEEKIDKINNPSNIVENYLFIIENAI